MYADWVASSRSLSFIEEYIRDEVTPLYANTHTTSSTSGHQTSLYREEARLIIARTINARDDKDALIFTGTGSTGAVNHLVRAMRLTVADKKKDTTPEDERPVVLVGLHEHHSNLLPWRESVCQVVNVPEDTRTGLIDMVALERLLKNFSGQGSPSGGTYNTLRNFAGNFNICPLFIVSLAKALLLTF